MVNFILLSSVITLTLALTKYKHNLKSNKIQLLLFLYTNLQNITKMVIIFTLIKCKSDNLLDGPIFKIMLINIKA